MKGKASGKHYDQDGNVRYKAMTYEAICNHLNMPSIDITIRCMRLQFLQAMVAEPLKHQLFWCSMLAKYEFEETAVSNPWAEQFCRDIACLEGLDGVQQLVTQVEHFAEKKRWQGIKNPNTKP